MSENINPEAAVSGATRRRLLSGLGAAAAGAGLLTLGSPQKAAAVSQASYYSSEPSRYVDTRLGWGGGRISGGQTHTVSIFAGLKGFALVCNLTVVATQGTGYLAVYNPDYGIRPIPFSSINWQGAGKIVANSTMLDIGETGIEVYCSGGSTTSTDYIMDVVGYFTVAAAPAPAQFTAWEKEAKRRLEREQLR